MSSNRRPGDPLNSKTRAGYVIPHQPPRIDEYDDPTTQQKVTLPVADPPPPAQAQRPIYVPPAAPAIQSAPVSTPDGGMARPKAPTIEVEYVHETDLNAARTANWPMLEIWTRNRVYHVDANMLCIAVINRVDGQPEANHSLKGTKLTGGERRSKSSQAVEIYYPFPMPGTEAVFRNESKRNGSYGHTSTIERVVLRVRKMRVGTIDSAPSWDEITGRFTVR